MNLKNKDLLETTTSEKHNISIRKCNEKDIKKIPKKYNNSEFLKDLKKGHIMIGAFENDNVIGWIWLSYKKVYVTEIEKWTDFNGGYVWRAHVFNEFRKKEIGKILVEKALKIAEKTSNKKEINSIVETNNIPSQRMLESKGFKKQKIISYFKLFKYKKWKEKIVNNISQEKKY